MLDARVGGYDDSGHDEGHEGRADGGHYLSAPALTAANSQILRAYELGDVPETACPDAGATSTGTSRGQGSPCAILGARRDVIVATDGDEERCATLEEVSRIVAQYQMEHPHDPNLRRISVVRRSGGKDEHLPAQQFLPQQIP